MRHYLRAHHTIDLLEEIGVERGSAQRSFFTKDERGSSSIGRDMEPFQKQRWEISEIRDGEDNYGLFRARRYHLQLNWTEQEWKLCCR